MSCVGPGEAWTKIGALADVAAVLETARGPITGACSLCRQPSSDGSEREVGAASCGS